MWSDKFNELRSRYYSCPPSGEDLAYIGVELAFLTEELINNRFWVLSLTNETKQNYNIFRRDLERDLELESKYGYADCRDALEIMAKAWHLM